MSGTVSIDEDFCRRSAAYYEARLAEHGPGARGMDWRDRESQHLRFERITRHMDFRGNPTVLDLGCGDGEFLAFCRERGRALRYTGIDVSPAMVELCRARHGREAAGCSRIGEVAASGQRYDYVVASGTFNVKEEARAEAWSLYVRRSVGAMFRVCLRAAIFNTMSPWVDWRHEHLWYPGPAELAELALECGTRRFVLDHSYPLYEWTAVLFRDDGAKS